MNRTMSVAQLSGYLKGMFDDEELLHDVTLTGEVAEVSYSDRHTFLVLADGDCSVRCVHFSARDNIEKGMRVALRGSVGFYGRRNTVSFVYSEFFMQGVGDKNARLAELKRKLGSLGYFENRPQLPKYVTDVTVITSPDGAAIRDFIRVVHDKNPFVRIRVYPVKVQGEGAAAQMTLAVKSLQTYKTDALVLCRGGGSDEDLDCFNDEALAVAVAGSAIPVISAVGHEVDWTLCDCCAGTRAGTPSIAGDIVNSKAGKIVSDIYEAVTAVKELTAKRYAYEARRLNGLGYAATHAVSMRIGNASVVLKSETERAKRAVKSISARYCDRVSDGGCRLRTAMSARISAEKAKLDKYSAILNALDPHRIIKIGYAAVLKKDVRIVSARQLSKDDKFKLVFGDGTVTARVTEKESV